jgi:flagellar biosynthesis chaperone FliJ
MEDQINSKCQNLQKAKDDEILKRKQFLEADNSLKSVVRLKEKQQIAHIEDQLSKEELEMEDIINSRFNFNSNLKIKNEY